MYTVDKITIKLYIMLFLIDTITENNDTIIYVAKFYWQLTTNDYVAYVVATTSYSAQLAIGRITL